MNPRIHESVRPGEGPMASCIRNFAFVATSMLAAGSALATQLLM